MPRRRHSSSGPGKSMHTHKIRRQRLKGVQILSNCTSQTNAVRYTHRVETSAAVIDSIGAS